jgi:cell division protein ZapB
LNLLTKIPLGYYSGEMISEFHQLTEKVSELAAMMQSLRRENAALRQASAALASENAELTQRMQEAHARVAALLASMPAHAPEESVL